MNDELPAGARIIGGEDGHRGFLGLNVKGNPVRWIGLGIVIPGALVMTLFIKTPALVIGFVLAAVLWLVTIRTERGSVFSRMVRKRRWRIRRADGSDHFVLYTEEAWTAAQDELKAARGGKKKAAARRRIRALRANPDGADRLGWLQHEMRKPGIAWQAPIGEQDRLTVAFELPGQVRGIATAATVNYNAEAFGTFLAARVSGLASQVQIVTRVLPTDSATYEQWIRTAIDPDAPLHLQQSYKEAVDRAAQGTTQRHFLTVTWPLGVDFRSTALRFGEGTDGWRELMSREIKGIERELHFAGYLGAHALSARQLAALMRHMQNPSRPLDFISDTPPDRFGEASRDEFSAHIVSGYDPISGEAVEWWHRTARLDPAQLTATYRTPLWHLPLFVSSKLNFIRTVSFHIEPTSADVARARTRNDLVSDAAEKLAKAQKGILDDGSNVNVETAARSRANDLRAGSGHHGAYWVGYITVSARTRSGLAQACRDLETLCRTDLDVARLEWLDSYQAAASGTTWPIGRGLKPMTQTGGERLAGVLKGRADKEALT